MNDNVNPEIQAIDTLRLRHNFRDLGGHRSLGGQMIRRGLVYRSGDIAAAKPDEVAQLIELGVVAICDLRSGAEHEVLPNRWVGETQIDYWRWGESVSVGDSLTLLRDCSQSEKITLNRMQEVYRQIPYEQADSFRELFTRLAIGKTPIIFHCVAGKDRTGVAAAILLSLLGVPRPVIFEDFALTNQHFKLIHRRFLSDPRHTELTSSNESAWLPMLKAQAIYLEAMFAKLEQVHGSVENYFTEIIGLAPDMQEKIRDHLLEQER